MNTPINIFDDSNPHLGLRVNELYAERDASWLRVSAYVAIAIAALIAGLMMGQIGGEAPAGSRIAWPKTEDLQLGAGGTRGRSWARIAWPAPAELRAQSPSASSTP
jgi:hypothetical protein